MVVGCIVTRIWTHAIACNRMHSQSTQDMPLSGNLTMAIGYKFGRMQSHEYGICIDS